MQDYPAKKKKPHWDAFQRACEAFEKNESKANCCCSNDPATVFGKFVGVQLNAMPIESRSNVK
jgi:hypothetical protein